MGYCNSLLNCQLHYSLFIIQYFKKWTGEMVQQLRELTALIDNLVSFLPFIIPRTAQNYL